MASADSDIMSPDEHRVPIEGVESANVHHCCSYICFLEMHSSVLLHDLSGSACATWPDVHLCK